MFVFGLIFLLTACASTDHDAPLHSAEKLAGSFTGKLGEKKNPAPLRSMNIRLDAAPDLNADDDGKGHSIVMRIYQLRDPAVFISLSRAALFNEERARNMLGSDLIRVRELTLVPEKTIRLNDIVAEGASHIGVVALFRKRSAQRWRLVFASADTSRSSIIVGVHACAMTATGAVPLGATVQDALLLSVASCK